jgi:EAL domain-containing protein (putative c-di-GMP-specific phosphodiesterase class I)
LAAAADFMERLRGLGCRTALDDFGVGYCSFAYLKDLPVDYVKIDGSFVRDIGKDALQLAMVKSMNEIAHAMGKQTVAEFVEDERVFSMLRSIGVDYVQGYLTGRPQLADWSPQSEPRAAQGECAAELQAGDRHVKRKA